MGSRANARPPLIINASSIGYANIISVEDDDEKTVIQDDDTDTEGSLRGKKKRKTGTSNELIEALKQKWEEDKEAERIIHAENQTVREKHLDVMEKNMKFSRSIAESFKIIAEKMK